MFPDGKLVSDFLQTMSESSRHCHPNEPTVLGPQCSADESTVYGPQCSADEDSIRRAQPSTYLHSVGRADIEPLSQADGDSISRTNTGAFFVAQTDGDPVNGTECPSSRCTSNRSAIPRGYKSSLVHFSTST
jgi:hypothetical protein